jgi:hypothetical protein
MVQPGKLERVRLVQDGGREVGSRVTANVLSTDRDTLFPLQGALGYDMVQHLFIAPHNLIVEGTSDFTFLNLLSAHLASLGRSALDPKWSIIPVGGADLIPSFVALFDRAYRLPEGGKSAASTPDATRTIEGNAADHDWRNHRH